MKRILGMRKVLLGLVIGLLAAGGTATAASYWVNGHRLVHRSVPPVALEPYAIYGSKLHAGSITYSKLGRTVKGYLARNAAPGPQGPKGATGATGTPGQALVANEQTPTTTVKVLKVDGPVASNCTDLVNPVTLAAGTYLVHSAADVFATTNPEPTTERYGEVHLYLNGVGQATAWTGNIPEDATVAGATTSGSIAVTVPSAGGTVRLCAIIRTNGHAGTGSYTGGGSLVVTKLG